jgi:hypothetical protein
MTLIAPPLQGTQLQPGTILSSSWGYSMTIVDFYVVVRCTEKTAWVRQIESHEVDHGPEGGHAVPELTRKPKLVFHNRADGQGGELVEAPIKSFRIKKDRDGEEWLWNSKLQRTMRIWNGKQLYSNHWD